MINIFYSDEQENVYNKIINEISKYKIEIKQRMGPENSIIIYKKNDISLSYIEIDSEGECLVSIITSDYINSKRNQYSYLEIIELIPTVISNFLK